MTCKAHHYVLDEPSGHPQVEGRCKRCNKKRMFSVMAGIPDNWLQYYDRPKRNTVERYGA